MVNLYVTIGGFNVSKCSTGKNLHAIRLHSPESEAVSRNDSFRSSNQGDKAISYRNECNFRDCR